MLSLRGGTLQLAQLLTQAQYLVLRVEYRFSQLHNSLLQLQRRAGFHEFEHAPGETYCVTDSECQVGPAPRQRFSMEPDYAGRSPGGSRQTLHEWNFNSDRGVSSNARPATDMELVRKMSENRALTFHALGEFIFEFSQLEFTIRFALAAYLGLHDDYFDAVTGPNDFRMLCAVTSKVGGLPQVP